MVNWDEVATKFGYKDSAEMWTDLYINKQLSVSQLERKFGVSRNPIRAALAASGIQKRGRGGPNRKFVVITDELIENCRRDGIAKTAKAMGLDYTTLYKRLKSRGLGPKELKALKPPLPPDDTVPPDLEAELDHEEN
jgi:hypothetical protein